jgi:DNA-binding PadR family transcriptional regulator
MPKWSRFNAIWVKTGTERDRLSVLYELIILSLLMRCPTHGYVIIGVINDVVGPRAKASNGRVYPLLTKLDADGLIQVAGETVSDGGRLARIFTITKKGRRRFRELMLDSSSNPREQRELFAFKVTAFDHITKQERIGLLEHYHRFATDHTEHQRRQAQDIAQATTYGHTDQERRRFASVFAHLVDLWEAEATWAGTLLELEKRLD